MSGFINALPGAISQGLIWGIMAIGVYITYKILDIADLTVDGSFCTGGATFVVLFGSGANIWLALLAAIGAGMLAGLATGILHTFCGIPAILAGILTQLGLWSINLAVMGMKANVAINVIDQENLDRLLVSLRFVQDVAKHKNVLIRSAVKDQRGDRHQRIEPSARLIHTLADEICGELAFEHFLVFKGIVPLSEGHGTRVKPAVNDLGNALHLAAAIGALNGDRINEGAVQLNILRAI